MSEWISVKDGLPKPCGGKLLPTPYALVLACNDKDDVFQAVYICDDGIFLCCCCLQKSGNVTHWMPMPEPPEGIAVLLVEPEKEPRVTFMPNTLEAFQEAVGGYIEVVHQERFNHADNCVVICNEEAKLCGLPHNRIITLQNGKPETIAGTFLVVGTDGEEFCGISPRLAAMYSRYYRRA